MSARAGSACKNDPRIDELAEALKTLADSSRLRIMCFLLTGERCAGEVVEELCISQQLTSHHLHVLKEAGLLKVCKAGTRSNYSVNTDKLREISETFGKYLDYRKAISCC